MKKIMPIVETCFVSVSLVCAGMLACFWLFMSMHGALAHCAIEAARAPFCPF